MKLMKPRFSTSRNLPVFVLASLTCSLLVTEGARAGDRVFLVTLATSPKQYLWNQENEGEPPSGLTSPQSFVNAYLREDPDDGVGSFAEYWEEISYGDVTITGHVSDWVLLPWPIQPLLADPESGNGEDAARHTPERFIDMNRDGQFTYGASEVFTNTLAMAISDLDGDENGQDNGPYDPDPGSGHTTRRGRSPVWKPGERYVDVDRDGRWDGLDENRNWMDHDGDNRPDNLGPWIDLNGDKEAQAPDGCVYLTDSDNDGNPDCCPAGNFIGVGGNRPCQCDATQWSTPDGDIIDCNGNLLNDVDEIEAGYTPDELPWVPDEDGEECVPGEGDDVPDVCQFENAVDEAGQVIPCREPGEPDIEDPCASLDPCEPIPEAEEDIPQRCEYDDSNNSRTFDIVEPFENFLRRWDPCAFAPEASPTLFQDPRTHWVKVYDPFARNGKDTVSCSDPTRSTKYWDSTVHGRWAGDPVTGDPAYPWTEPSGTPSYIQNNYPGKEADWQELEEEAGGRAVYGQHDPDNLLQDMGLDCVCFFDCEGNFVPDGYPCFIKDLDGDLEFGPTEQNLCCAGIHADYDPPDLWQESIPTELLNGEEIHTSKLRPAPGRNGRTKYVPNKRTPKPGDGPMDWEQPWFEAAWKHRYNDPAMELPSLADEDPPLAESPAPEWPRSAGFENIPLIEPWGQLDPDSYEAEQDRRYFNANFGGINGRGVGWTSFEQEFMRWETFLTGIVSFEENRNAAILPEEIDGEDRPGIFFDGWIEYDDLPSSKYHMAGDQAFGEVTSPFATWFQDFTVPPDDRVDTPQIWGEDLGSGLLGSIPGQVDDYIPAAGPYATGVHANFGRDAGNQLMIEYLTWRTDGTSPSYGIAWEEYYGIAHPYAGDGGGFLLNGLLGFRDYNLDGMIDQGEVRPPGSENYIVDSVTGTPNNGMQSQYPFHRRRIVEDCIAALDEVLDFNDFIDPVALAQIQCSGRLVPAGVPLQFGVNPSSEDGHYEWAPEGAVSGIVILPPEAWDVTTVVNMETPFNQNPFFYPIHNEDYLGDASFFPPGEDFGAKLNLAFHDLVYREDGRGETPTGSQGTGALQTAFAAHEYGHSWENFPDLYDYDEYGGPGAVVNCPIGIFDIMAWGELVHPVPILKESRCSEWIKPTDLTTRVTPGVPATITLPRAEFVRDDAYYYIENGSVNGVCAPSGVCEGGVFDGEPCNYGSEDADAACESGQGERFYFWSAGAGFDEAFPGEGMLILHTDTGSDPGALPAQQATGTRFAYKIVQADGLDELTAGPGVDPSCGDAGDLWPGTTGATEFDFNTNPPARWYAQNSWTGLKITDIRPDGAGSIAVDLVWVPVLIPSLSFVRPPGGVSVGDVYNIRVEATDLHGGTLMKFFYTNDPEDYSVSEDNFIGLLEKEVTGTFELSRPWNISGLPDGQYWLFAQLIPGEGIDGIDEWANTPPRSGRNNVGNGTLEVLSVDAASPTEFGPAIKIQSAPGEAGWVSEVALHEPLTSADFTQLGVTAGDTLRILDAADSITTGDYVIWRIDGQNLALAAGADPRDGSGPYEITDYQIRRSGSVLYDRPGGGALPKATIVEFPGFLAGSQLDFENEGVVPGDRLFIVPVSGTTSIVGVIASIEGDPNAPNDMRTLRLSSTLFPDGQTYAVKSWQVRTTGGARLETWTATCVDIDGDENDFIVYGTLTQPEPPDSAEDQDPYPHVLVDRVAGSSATYTSIGGEVVFRITQDTKLFEIGDFFIFSTTGITALSKPVTIANGQIKEAPTAIISASPLEGPAPLTVTFDGRDSVDPNGDPLTYLWRFDDSSPPASGPVVQHTFTQSRTFSVSLRVTNTRNGLFDEAFVDIVIANNSPKAVMRATPTSGPTGLTVTFDGSSSSDTETPPDELIYEWAFGDGLIAGNGEPGEYVTVEHYYGNDGMYAAKLTVTDEGGKQDMASVDILVGNTRPTPVVTYGALEGSAPHEVVFNAKRSFDPEDDSNPDIIDPKEEMKMTWRWSDGSPEETWPIRGANGATDGSVPHIFEDIRSYEVTGTLTDSEGASTNWPGVTVVVREFLPGESDPQAIFCRRIGNECVPIEDNPPLLNEEFTVDAFLSFDRPTGGTISRYLWTFGDGTTAQGVMATHTYTVAGTYTIRLVVEDNEDPPNTGTIGRTFTVREEGTGPGPGEVNHPPTAVIIANPLTGIAGETKIRFDASTSTDEDEGDQAQLRYSWNFGDGTTGQGVVVEHTYDQPGLYRVRLTVTDPQNGSSTATQQIDIRVLTENRDPLAFITTGIRSTTVGGTLRFNGSTSFDPDGDVIAEYRWVFKQDDGTMIDELAGVEVERAFLAAGNYTVQLIVTDEHGAVGESQIETIIVTARATVDNENDNEEPIPPTPIPPSEDQRPGLCGFGMLQSVFGMLLCLTAMAAGRRRYRL